MAPSVRRDVLTQLGHLITHHRVAKVSSSVGEGALVAVLVRLSKAVACAAARGSLPARRLSLELKASPWASCSLPTMQGVAVGPCSS